MPLFSAHKTLLSAATIGAAVAPEQGAGYWAGGANGGGTQESIERMLFLSNTVETVTAVLNIARSNLTGVSSTISGYFGGSLTPSSAGEIDGIIFATNTTNNPAQSLTTNTTAHGSGYSDVDGYWSNLTGTDRFNFNTETIQTESVHAANTATSIAVNFPEKCVYAGTSSSLLLKYTFVTATSEILSDTVASCRQPSAMSAPFYEKGFWCGGVSGSGPESFEIVGVNEASETSFITAAVILLDPQDPAGNHSSQNGYSCGGNVGGGQSVDIYGLNFNTETFIDPSSALTVGRQDLAGANG